MTTLPTIFRVRQKFDPMRVADVTAETRGQLEKLNLAARIKRGQSVAITAGSRGIANIKLITKAIVDHVKSLGAEPFIVPAMGSHGGGTAEGQLEILDLLRHHRSLLRLPDPLQHGDGRRLPDGRRVSTCTSIATPSAPITCWSATASSPTPASSAKSKAG